MAEEIRAYLDEIYKKMPEQKVVCRRCGNCCTKQIGMSIIEFFNMKYYVVKNKIRFNNNGKCIFLANDDIPHVCNIYPVRPWICRAYRPLEDGDKAYYLDLKKKRTTETCAYVPAVMKNGKIAPSEHIISAVMILELQIAWQNLLNIPDKFIKKDDTFKGWGKSLRNHRFGR